MVVTIHEDAMRETGGINNRGVVARTDDREWNANVHFLFVGAGFNLDEIVGRGMIDGGLDAREAVMGTGRIDAKGPAADNCTEIAIAANKVIAEIKVNLRNFMLPPRCASLESNGAGSVEPLGRRKARGAAERHKYMPKAATSSPVIHRNSTR